MIWQESVVLRVKVSGQHVADLFEEGDEVVLQYLDNVPEQLAISLTMPVRKRPYTYFHLHPFFQMHLPEGYLRSVIIRQFAKIHRVDDFGLLMLLAPSFSGRVQFESSESLDVEPFTLEALRFEGAELFEALVQRFALRSPVSGVQPKVLATIQDKVTLNVGSYLVKSWGPDFPELALNEYICLKVCRVAGLAVPNAWLSDDRKLLIVERFDLNDVGFEDACVLQGKAPDEKYEGSYERLAKTLSDFASPANRRSTLIAYFQTLCVCMKLGNGDAHLKNFGLYYSGLNTAGISPIFDVVNTRVYLPQDLPVLTIHGRKRWPDSKQLIQFGTEHCQLSHAEATTILDNIHEAIEQTKIWTLGESGFAEIVEQHIPEVLGG